MKIKAITQYSKRLIAVAAATMALIIVQPFLWNFVARTAADVHQRQSQKQQLAALQEKISGAEAAAAAHKEFLNQLDIVVPLKISLPQTVERLERLAAEQHITINFQAINPVSDDVLANSALANIVPVTISLTAAGTPAQLLKYLESVEHVQELTLVDNWSLSQTTATASLPQSIDIAVPLPAIVYDLAMTVTFFLHN